MSDPIARQATVAVLDLELTGLDVDRDRICEVAVVRAVGGVVVDVFSTLIHPPVALSEEAARLTGLSDADLAGAPEFRDVAERVTALLADAVVVCHNADTDLTFLHRELDAVGVPFDPPPVLDTLWMARRLFSFQRNNLSTVAQALGVASDVGHRALGDARTTLAVLTRMLEVIDPSGAMTVGELNDLVEALAPDSPLRLRQKRTLQRSYRERRTVVVEYQDTGHPERGTVRREIAVWLLRLPYLQAWCFLRQGERVFRLDRARVVEPGPGRYEIPAFVPRI
jgi:DNA polymerase-3 subunit epsilon